MSSEGCRREDSGRFIAEVRGDDPELASNLRIEERELKANELNLLTARSRSLRSMLGRLRRIGHRVELPLSRDSLELLFASVLKVDA
jgi:hypothetical protein